MKEQKLENIGVGLVLIAGISALSVMFYEIISISIAFVWISLATIGIVLIVFSSIKKSPKEQSNTYKPEKYPYVNKIGIWLRQLAVFIKIKDILLTLPISHNIKDKNDSTKDYSLHADNLPQEDKSVNNPD